LNAARYFNLCRRLQSRRDAGQTFLSREKWSESAILKILSPVRLPFRHTGIIYLQRLEQVPTLGT
jgi:hypothetical protein